MQEEMRQVEETQELEEAEESMMEEEADDAEQEESDGSEDTEESEEMMEEEAMEEVSGLYIDAFSDVAVADAAIGHGENSLLFFFASWCGACQNKHGTLHRLYTQGSYPVATYRVNYDEVEDLKAKYGITTQDTVVLIDGEGNALETKLGATEEDLKALLSS